MRTGVLGPVVIEIDGDAVNIGGPKHRLVWALLVHDRGRVVSVDRIIDGVWGDDLPTQAKKNVQVYISNIRKALGPAADTIESSGAGYQITTDVASDVHEFEALVSSADEVAAANPIEAAHLLDQALALWRGAPYADCDSPVLSSEISRLEELRLVALERRMELELDLGRHTAALAELSTLCADYPYRERLHQLQMLALYRSGRQAEALRAFSRLRTRLVDELGIDPNPEIQQLEQRILDQDPSLIEPADAAAEETVFLFTDLVGSTALWERDESAMAEALQHHDQVLEKAISVTGGRIWKHTGDGVLAVMPDVESAARAATEAQAGVAGHPMLSMRVAIHRGVAQQRGGDYYGPGLNVCARVLSVAHGGQVLVSDDAMAAGSIAGAYDLGEHNLRGLAEPMSIHQLGGHADQFPPLQIEAPLVSMTRLGFGRSIRGFELRERLGAGPAGEVYRAFQTSTSREVALKIIDPSIAGRPEFVRRFEAEARLVSQLEHPHIVPVYDAWRDPEGAYLAMRQLRGGSLDRALRVGSWKPSSGLRLLGQIGSALAFAHRKGVLHLDIHAGNVLLDEDDNAYLSDFAIGGAPSGLFPHIATADHAAPEVRRGEAPSVAADVYSFGRLALHVLGEDAVADVIAKATHDEPSRRYERVEDLLRALRQALGADVVLTDAAPRVDGSEIRNPYKGLRAFQESDAEDFFGREDLVQRLLESVTTGRLIAIVGPSGCGKSSAVKAGLLPELRDGSVPGTDEWHITEMFPGGYPFEELEEALLRIAVDRPERMIDDLRADELGLVRVAKEILPAGDAELLLVIDQFEELFSLTQDEDTRRAFMDMLAATASDPTSRVRIVITMRADFFDRPLAYPGFGELLENSVVPVAVPSEDGLTLAIARPARLVGLEIEPGLVGQIVRDVANQPGALPLMQHALTELFIRGQGRLTIQAYEDSGGVLGALGRRAEELYQGLTPAARPVARQLLLRLVIVEEDASDVRRRAKRTELRQLGIDQGAMDEVLQAFGSFRLLTFDQDPASRTPTIEVAHEALLREWDRLRQWIEDEHEGLTRRRRLIAAAAEWRAAGLDSAYLLAGGRLEEFEDWAASTELSLTAAEREFLARSRDEEDRRRARRTRARTAVGAVLAAAAAVAVVFAFIARSNQELAEARELAASAISTLDTDPELSVLLAIEAASVADPPPEAERALHEAVQSLRLTDSVPIVDAGVETIVRTENYAAYAAAAGRLITTGDGEELVEWTVTAEGALQRVHQWDVDGAPMSLAAVSVTSDRSIVGAVAEDGRAVFWSDGQMTEFTLPAGSPGVATYSADGSLAAVRTSSSVTSSTTILLVDPRDRSGEPKGSIEISPPIDMDMLPDGSAVLITTFSPGGTYLIPITADGFGEPTEPIPFPTQATQSDLRADGMQIVSSGTNGWLYVTDLESGMVRQYHAHDSHVRSIRYNGDGSLLATGGDDGTIRLFDPANGRELSRLLGQGSPVRYIAFTEDGEHLISAGQDFAVNVWDLTSAPNSELASVELGQVDVQAFSLVGDRAVVLTRIGRRPGPAFIVNLTDLSVERRLDDQWGASIGMSTDGTSIALMGPGVDDPQQLATGDVVIRNGAGDELLSLVGICEGLTSSATIHDRDRLERACQPYNRPTSRPGGVTLSPSGSLVAVAGTALSVSDAATGDLLAAAMGFPTDTIVHRKDHIAIAFTADEETLIAGVDTGDVAEILVLDARTLAVKERYEVEGNWSGHGRLSPDERYVLMPTAPGTIDIVDLETGEVESRDAHDSSITAMRFAADGTLITAGSNGEIQIREVGGAFDLIEIIPYTGGSIEGIAMRGTHLIVVNAAGTIATLTTDLDELLDVALTRTTRQLTDDECLLYMHEEVCP